MSYATQTILIAVDRSLTAEQRKEAELLSSRAVVSSGPAWYMYHFGGSFRGNTRHMPTTGGFDAALWDDSAGGVRPKRLKKGLKLGIVFFNSNLINSFNQGL